MFTRFLLVVTILNFGASPQLTFISFDNWTLQHFLAQFFYPQIDARPMDRNSYLGPPLLLNQAQVMPLSSHLLAHN